MSGGGQGFRAGFATWVAAHCPVEKGGPWVFRGHADTCWKLEPTFLRLLRQLGVEDRQTAVAMEKAGMRAFQQVSPLNLGATDDEWIFWWGMIQHYSGFSRVLDWTGSPDVALYFATKEPMDKPGRVWALNLSKIPEPPECFAECPPNLPAALLEQHPILENGVPFFIHRCTVRKRQTRVSAQKGWFTTCSDVLVDHKEAVQRVTNAGSNALEHFDVPKEEKAGTLTWLGSKGILGARLFADAPDGMGYSQIQSVVAEYCRTKAPGS